MRAIILAITLISTILRLQPINARLGSSSCNKCVDLDLDIDRPSLDMKHLILKGDTLLDTGYLVTLEYTYYW